MTTQGYPPLTSTGWGCTLEMEQTVSTAMLRPWEGGTAAVAPKWIPIGQIRAPGIALEMEQTEEEITPAYAQWKQFVPGQKVARLSCTCLYTPMAINFAIDDLPNYIGTSLGGQFTEGSVRLFRLSIPWGEVVAGSRDYMQYEFDALVKRLRYALPINDTMNVSVELLVAGSVRPSGINNPDQYRVPPGLPVGGLV